MVIQNGVRNKRYPITYYYHLNPQVYVGDLIAGASRNEVEEAFEKYGELKSVWVARNPPGFAFVEFMEPLDAKDAVHEMDGR